jgi:PST family polysaccharide transporter
MCNRLVNDQAQIGMLLAGPGMIATLAFAPLVIALFYTAKFSGAIDTLRWICLGVAVRVITWPMGYIIIAKGEQAIFFWTEFGWTLMNIGLTWACIGYFGLTGAGVAFFASYVFHGSLIYFVVRRLSGFRWSSESWRTAQLFVVVIALGLGAFYLLPVYAALALGAAVLIASTVHSLRSLVSIVGTDRIPRPVRQLLRVAAA